jgi:hypothetical protein
VALIGDGLLRWATMGDSAIFVASPTEVKRLDRPQHRFMGWPKMSREGVAENLQTGTAELRPASWVVLATDGFLDFVPSHLTSEQAIWDACATANRPSQFARALVEVAFSGNARDNVAVAVAGPTSSKGALVRRDL